MGFESKCSILNGQAIYIEKLEMNVADMWLIPLIMSHMVICAYFPS